MRKRLISLCTALVLICTIFAPLGANADDLTDELIIKNSVVLLVESNSALVNGIVKQIDNDSRVVPVIKDDRTFVPIRFISENLGADVAFDEGTNTVSIKTQNINISLVIDKPAIIINDDMVELDAAPYVENDRTLVPIRAVSEGLNKKVAWNDNGVIVIGDNDEVSSELAVSLCKMLTPVNVPADIEEITECNTEDYFVADGPLSPHMFAYGSVRPDEGSVQIKMKPGKSVEQFGNDWDFAFIMRTAKTPTPQGAMTILGIYLQPMPDKGLTCILRGKTERSTAIYEDFSYTPDEDMIISITWKAGGKLNMYQNGKLVCSVDCPQGINDDVIPYQMEVESSSKFGVSEIKVDTRELSASEVSADPTKHFGATASTSLISTDKFNTIEYRKTDWHESEKYSGLIPADRYDKKAYKYGENVVYPVMYLNHSGEDKVYDVKLSAVDTEGNTCLDKTVKVPAKADGKYHINEIAITELNDIGYYDLTSSVSLDGNVISEYVSSVVVTPAENTALKDGKYADYYGSENSLRDGAGMLNYIGARVTRNMETFAWRTVEPEKGKWTWDITDEYVEECKENNVDILAVLGKPSRWATQEPSADEFATINGISQSPDRWNIKSIDEWSEYVYQTVSRYKDYVKHWEIINEVNFHPPALAAAFLGTTEDYLVLLKAAYEAAKKADPDCKILTSGFSGVADMEMPLVVAGEKYSEGYYDMFNVHGYHGVSPFREIIDEFRKNKPGADYWMTEYMPFQIADENMKMYTNIQMLLDFIEDGSARHIDMGFDSNANVYFDCASRSPKKVLSAMTTNVGFLKKCDSFEGKVEFSDSSYFSIRHMFKRTDGSCLTMLSSSGSPTKVTVNGECKEIYDIYGRKVEGEYDGEVTAVPVDTLAYIVTDEPISITGMKKSSGASPVQNGGFENTIGDIAGGIDSLSPLNWEDVKDNDESTLLITDEAAVGKYAVILNSVGGKTGYKQTMFEASPSTYDISARVKLKSGKNVKAYLAIDSGNGIVEKETFAKLTTDEFTIIETVLSSSKEDGGAVFEFGIEGEGEVIFDVVKVEKQLSEEDSAFNLLANPSFSDGMTSFRSTNKTQTGKIEIVENGITGTSAKVTADGTGKIYVISDTSVKSPGRYKYSVRFKRVTGRNVIPYVGIYDVLKDKINEVSESKLYGYKYVTTTVYMDFDEPASEVKVYAGVLSGAGEILVDDVYFGLVAE